MCDRLWRGKRTFRLPEANRKPLQAAAIVRVKTLGASVEAERNRDPGEAAYDAAATTLRVGSVDFEAEACRLTRAKAVDEDVDETQCRRLPVAAALGINHADKRSQHILS